MTSAVPFVAGLATFLAVFFALPAGVLWTFLAPVAMLVPLWLWPVRWQVDADGLVIRYAVRAPRRLAWADLTAVVQQPGRVLVETAGRSVTITHPDIGAELLARWPDTAAGRRSHAARPLPPEQLAEQLGLAPGELFACDRPRFVRFANHWLTNLAGFALLAAALLRVSVHAAIGALFLGGLDSLFPRRTGACTRVVAEANGLTISHRGRPRYLGWGELRGVHAEPQPGFKLWHIEHVHGQFEVTSLHTQGERLAEMCRRAIALREEGWQLPATEEIPEGALSRATGDDSDAERGISLASDSEGAT